MESALARSDRRICDVIEAAWRLGARFDLWDECFNYDLWIKAFDTHGLNLELQAQKKFEPDDYLPWQHLGGPDKKYLQSFRRDGIAY